MTDDPRREAVERIAPGIYRDGERKLSWHDLERAHDAGAAHAESGEDVPTNVAECLEAARIIAEQRQALAEVRGVRDTLLTIRLEGRPPTFGELLDAVGKLDAILAQKTEVSDEETR